MALKLANNAVSVLAAPITNTDLTLTLQTGGGAKFPVLGGGDWCPVTVVKTDGTLEIMRCTARTVDTLTVTRGQEGTTPLAFAANDRVEVRWTVAAADEFLRRTGGLGSVMTGDLTLANSTPSDPLHAASKGYADAAIYPFSAVYKMTGARVAATTLAISGAGARLMNAARTDAKMLMGAFSFTINLATASAALGRDQAGNFSGQWVHIHVIWGATPGLSAIASASSTAPTLPTGYTHSAYGFPIRIGATVNQMFPCIYSGLKATYQHSDGATLAAQDIYSINLTMANWAVYVAPNATHGRFAGSAVPRCDGAGNMDTVLSIYASGDAVPAIQFAPRLIGMGPTSDNNIPVAGELRNSGNPVATASISTGSASFGLFLVCTGYDFQPAY